MYNLANTEQPVRIRRTDSAIVLPYVTSVPLLRLEQDRAELPLSDRGDYSHLPERAMMAGQFDGV